MCFRFLDEYENKTHGAKKTFILVEFLNNFLPVTANSFLHMNELFLFNHLIN